MSDSTVWKVDVAADSSSTIFNNSTSTIYTTTLTNSGIIGGTATGGLTGSTTITSPGMTSGGIIIDPSLVPSGGASISINSAPTIPGIFSGSGQYSISGGYSGGYVGALTTSQIASLSTVSAPFGGGIIMPNITVSQPVAEEEKPEEIDYLAAIHAVVGHK